MKLKHIYIYLRIYIFIHIFIRYNILVDIIDEITLLTVSAGILQDARNIRLLKTMGKCGKQSDQSFL